MRHYTFWTVSTLGGTWHFPGVDPHLSSSSHILAPERIQQYPGYMAFGLHFLLSSTYTQTAYTTAHGRLSGGALGINLEYDCISGGDDLASHGVHLRFRIHTTSIIAPCEHSFALFSLFAATSRGHVSCSGTVLQLILTPHISHRVRRTWALKGRIKHARQAPSALGAFRFFLGSSSFFPFYTEIPPFLSYQAY